MDRLAQYFLDLGSLAHSAAQIIQLTAAYTTLTNQLNAGNLRAVDGENSLDAAAVRKTANGEGFGDTTVLLGDYSTLEGLQTLTVTLLNTNLNTYGITDVNNRNILLQSALGHQFQCVHGFYPP